MIRSKLYGFGVFVLDPDQGILSGEKGIVGLPPKVTATLLALVERRGEIISKQELMETVWPDSFVEEGNLTQNIFLLRKELGKSPAGEDYIQTLPKRGYRLNVPVVEMDRPGVRAEHARPASASEESAVMPPGRRWLPGSRPLALISAAAALALGICLIAGAWVWRATTARLTASGYVQITHDGMVKRGHLISVGGPDAAIFTDGVTIYFTEGSTDSLRLAEVSALGGETARMPVNFGQPQLLDIARSRPELLVSGDVNPSPYPSLWAFSVPGGATRQLDVKARDASWSPDGQSLAFLQGADLFLAKRDGSDARKLVTLSGPGWMPRWSPDGKLIRLSVFDLQSSVLSLWEIATDGRGLHRLLDGWNIKEGPIDVCCGSWTPSGHDFIFQTTRLGRSEIWSMPASPAPWAELLLRFDRSMNDPVQLTDGQLSSLAPAISPNGQKLFVIGQQLRSELERYDARTKQFVSYGAPALSGISADFVDISRDGQWIAYVDFPGGTLWRSRLDGSERLQLTAPPMQVMVPFWSPDGSHIVFYGYNSGQQQQAFIISAQGGDARPAQIGGQNQMSTNWSPDGESVMYSDFPFFARDQTPVGVHILNLKTQIAQTLPGSTGMFGGMWSPDGSHAAAWAPNGRDLMLFDFQTRQWTQIASGGGFPIWSRDGLFVYFIRSGENTAVMRVRVSDKRVEEVASLKNIRLAGRLAGIALALTPQGDPLVLRDIGTQEIYGLDLHPR